MSNMSKAESQRKHRMNLFVVINNASTVGDCTPVKIFTDMEEAMFFLFEYEQKSIFKPIIMYEYTLINGSATFPKCFYRVNRGEKHLVEGIEKVPINSAEFQKNHPFLFDKFQSMFANSSENYRSC